MQATVSVAVEEKHVIQPMPDANPYAPPSTLDVVVPAPRWFRRDGKFVVIRTGAILPARCVKTNELLRTSDWFGEKQLSWMPRWARFIPLVAIPLVLLPLFTDMAHAVLIPFYAIGIPGILIAGLLPLAFQKRTKVSYALRLQQRRWRLAIQCAAVVGGWGGWFLCEATGVDSWATSVLIIVGSFLVGLVHHPLRVHRYRDGEFWLKGASPAFLDSLETR